MKFSIKDFFSECDQIRSFQQIWSHLRKQSLMENFIFCDVYISTNCISITSILAFQVLLKSGHIEINPGPKKPSAIKFCHWNLNELAVHNFVKVPSIKAFITAHSIDIVCLSEVVLDSTIPHSDENININGYSLLRVDHPNNIKWGGFCMYFKESLPLIRWNDLSNMKECLETEINVNNEKRFFRCPYRPSS